MLGIVASLIAYPFFCLAFMAAAHSLRSGQIMAPHILFQSFSSAPGCNKTLFFIGMFFCIALMSMLGLSVLISFQLEPEGGKVAFAYLQQIFSNPNYTGPSAAEAALIYSYSYLLSAFEMIAFILVAGLFYFTPALAYWGRSSVGKAIFFNIVACFKNLGAFVFYAVLWIVLFMGCMMLLGLLLSVVAGSLGSSLPGLVITSFLLFSSLMSLFSLFQISTYCAFKDTFILNTERTAEKVGSEM